MKQPNKTSIYRGFLLTVFLILFIFGIVACPNRSSQKTPEQLQLNWFHDPTFAGEYKLSQLRDMGISVKEGGPSVSPLSEVVEGRATYAVVGIDIFLQYLDKQINTQPTPNLVCIFVDFQRNPVGWILHPDAAAKAGFDSSNWPNGRSRNQWLFEQFRSGKIRPGDKRGTETTSVWVQWRKRNGLPETIFVEPVGFDPSVVLGAPNLAYPVYLNEEPFKLSAKLGRSVVTFDPVDDGIETYGNIVVCRKDFARQHQDRIKTIQLSLRSAWESVRTDVPDSAAKVAKVYKGVDQAIIEKQISQTVDFVFHGGKEAGTIDISPDGRLSDTLHALQESGLVSRNIRFTDLQDYFIPAK